MLILVSVIVLSALVGMVSAGNFPGASRYGAFAGVAAVNPYDDNSTVVTTETTQSTSEVSTSSAEVVTTTTTSETVTSSTEVITTTSAAASTTSDNSTSSTETVTTIVTSTTTTENTVTSSTETQTTTTYQVVFEVNPSGAGSTNPSGGMTYDAGSSFSISATANSGYAFSGWSVSDASSIALADSSSPTTTATINGVGTVTANFSPTTVNLVDTQTNVVCSASSLEVGGSVTCTATVTGGSSVSGQTVSWGSAGSGMFDSVECTLGDAGSCSVTYSPTDAGDGSHTLTANYAGDATHNASTGNFTLTVTGSTTITTTTVTSVTSSGDAKIWMDKEDYVPGDTPTIYGTGFLANAEVTVTVTRPEGTQNSWTVTTDESGSFTTSYATDALVEGTFTVTATDGTNTATTTFTDSTKIKFDSVAASNSVGTVQTSFSTSDDVYATITTSSSGSGDVTPAQGNVYVVSSASCPANNAAIGTDVSGGTEAVSYSTAGTFYQEVWHHPTTAGVSYHIIVDSTTEGTTGVFDNQKDVCSAAFAITAANAAPAAEAGGPYAGNEGSSISFTFSCADANTGDTWTASVTWGDSFSSNLGSVTCNSGTFSPSHTYADNGVYTVTLTVTDNSLASGSDTASVNISNVAPTATFNVPASVNEGSSISLSLTGASDPSSVDTAAGFTYAFDCGGGSGYGTPGSSNSVSCPTTDNGVRNVKGKIIDKDGGFTEYPASVTVNNVAPTITSVSNNGPINEGSSATVTVAATDPAGANDPLSYSFDCNNDLTYEIGPQASNSASCTFGDNGSFTVNVKVDDGDGGVTTGSTTVTVNNVAPTVVLSGPNSADEGQMKDYSFTVTDPGVDTFLVTVGFPDCGTGGVLDPASVGTDASGGSFSCSFPDGPASPVVRIRVTDSDGADSNIDSITVTVANVAPTVVLSGPNSADEGQMKDYSFTVTDPGVDTFLVTVGFPDCGTGGVLDPASVGTDASGGSFSCSFPDGPASPVVRIRVTDSDGADSNIDSIAVTVNNVPPTATFNVQSPVNEGSSFALSLTSPSDPSSVDTAAGFTYAFDCGSGYGSFGSGNSVSCPTTDNGIRNVGGKIRDKDGGVSTYTAQVTVNNVAPTATFNVPSPVIVGASFSLSLTNPFDPSSVDTAAGFTYAFDCGGGYGTPGSSNSVSCPTTDVGVRNVKGKIIDKDGGFTQYTGTVSVVYKFIGFFPPVDNPPVVNLGRAGRTIPIKFQLTDAKGNQITSMTPLPVTIRYIEVACGAFSGDPVDPAVIPDAAGATTLRYDGNQWIFNWQTSKTMAGKCYQIVVYQNNADGTMSSIVLATAYFQLKPM